LISVPLTLKVDSDLDPGRRCRVEFINPGYTLAESKVTEEIPTGQDSIAVG
jgi:hypothetical protein